MRAVAANPKPLEPFKKLSMKRFLLSPDPGDANGPGETPKTAEQINLPQTGRIETAAPPPSHEIVANGERDEKIVQLEQELADARDKCAKTEGEKVDREKTIMELQDQLFALKAPPKDKVDDRSELERWMYPEA